MSGRRSGPPRSFLAGLASAVVTLTLIVTLAAGGGLFAYLSRGPAAPSGAATTVILRRGAGLAEIAGALGAAHVIPSAPVFIALAEVTGSAHRIKSGEYLIPSRASISDILQKLRAGDIVRHKITVPEGASARQVRDLLTKADVLVGDTPEVAEGAVLPETYDVTRGETRAAVALRMTAAMDKVLAQYWAKRKADLPIHSPEEAVILASIVEKETAKETDRPRVAAVYINRLRIGMKLDADPTVIYGVTGGLPLGRGIRASELATNTPYNTYVHPGLPPTAIANPGRASIAAVLDPPQTNELYFVADGTGGAAFAATLADHEKNVARWREIERQKAGPLLRPSQDVPVQHFVGKKR
jgi:UPF0755 protein